MITSLLSTYQIDCLPARVTYLSLSSTVSIISRIPLCTNSIPLSITRGSSIQATRNIERHRFLRLRVVARRQKGILQWNGVSGGLRCVRVTGRKKYSSARLCPNKKNTQGHLGGDPITVCQHDGRQRGRKATRAGRSASDDARSLSAAMAYRHRLGYAIFACHAG